MLLPQWATNFMHVRLLCEPLGQLLGPVPDLTLVITADVCRAQKL